jgi:hypothetical protein
MPGSAAGSSTLYLIPDSKIESEMEVTPRSR